MHEMSLLRGLMNQIKAIARRHGAERVTAIRLKLGPLAHRAGPSARTLRPGGTGNRRGGSSTRHRYHR